MPAPGAVIWPRVALCMARASQGQPNSRSSFTVSTLCDAAAHIRPAFTGQPCSRQYRSASSFHPLCNFTQSIITLGPSGQPSLMQVLEDLHGVRGPERCLAQGDIVAIQYVLHTLHVAAVDGSFQNARIPRTAVLAGVPENRQLSAHPKGSRARAGTANTREGCPSLPHPEGNRAHTNISGFPGGRLPPRPHWLPCPRDRNAAAPSSGSQSCLHLPPRHMLSRSKVTSAQLRFSVRKHLQRGRPLRRWLR